MSKSLVATARQLDATHAVGSWIKTTLYKSSLYDSNFIMIIKTISLIKVGVPKSSRLINANKTLISFAG